MANTQQRVSAKEAAIEILGKQEKPMPVNDLAEQIMATPGVKLEGKTPKATIRKTLDRSDDFERTAPGMYRLGATAQNKVDERELDDEPEGDEFDVDLKNAAKAADKKATAAKTRAAKPHPKPSGRKTTRKVSA